MKRKRKRDEKIATLIKKSQGRGLQTDEGPVGLGSWPLHRGQTPHQVAIPGLNPDISV